MKSWCVILDLTAGHFFLVYDAVSHGQGDVTEPDGHVLQDWGQFLSAPDFKLRLLKCAVYISICVEVGLQMRFLDIHPLSPHVDNLSTHTIGFSNPSNLNYNQQKLEHLRSQLDSIFI